MTKTKNKIATNLNIGVYSIYDTALKTYEAPFSCPVSQLDNEMSMLVNTMGTKYYGHETQYLLGKIGDFNQETGKCEIHFTERVAFLDKWISQSVRDRQLIISTLNTLPVGYFSMPEEFKKDIQTKIDNAIKDYVNTFVAPNMETVKQDVKS